MKILFSKPIILYYGLTYADVQIARCVIFWKEDEYQDIIQYLDFLTL